MKAQWCDQCRHCDFYRLDESGRENPCTKGHKPRFYKPLTLSQAHSDEWGWKRKCEDFERSEK